MKINKKLIYIFLSLTIFFTGCQTTQSIFTMSSPSGQMFFIRPIQINKVSSELKAIDFDITVQSTTTGEITDDLILNYTILLSKENYALADDVKLCFDVNENRITPNSAEVIYKEIDASKNLNIRITSRINKDDFNLMLKDPYSTKVVILIKDKVYSFTVKELNEKLVEMGVLVS